MGREQSLLDRIAAIGEPGHGSGQASTSEDMEALMGSVRRNLARLLNARHGFSEALPDYGLPALTDLTARGRDYARSAQEAIRTAIEKYEPRLRRVRVSPLEDEGARQTLAFRIDAVLVGHSGEHRVCYDTAMSGEGQFAVSD